MRPGVLVGGLTLALAGALYSVAFLDTFLASWAAGAAVLGGVVTVIGALFPPRGGTRAERGAVQLTLAGVGLFVALVGTLWFLFLMNDIQTLEHQLAGSRGGFIAMDGFFAVFVAIPLAVAGAALALAGFLIGRPLSGSGLPAHPGG